MAVILVTGASGFIGRALAAELAGRHDVIAMSRRDPGLDLPWVQGEFFAWEDLRRLDGLGIDVAVHLAAVLANVHEREQMRVNVEGTRCLMRYLIDRGCRKLVTASSIAAVGIQDTRFRPLRLPVPDDHPCLDRSGYGFSKFMMEEVTRYCQRRNEEVDVVNLRLSSVAPDGGMPEKRTVSPLRTWTLGSITFMCLSDAVRAFALAAEAPHRAGVRTLNAASPRAWVADPVADILRGWWGEEVDVSWYEQPGREFDSAYDVRAIEKELGFAAEVTE